MLVEKLISADARIQARKAKMNPDNMSRRELLYLEYVLATEDYRNPDYLEAQVRARDEYILDLEHAMRRYQGVLSLEKKFNTAISALEDIRTGLAKLVKNPLEEL